jgi:hypothetical protein
MLETLLDRGVSLGKTLVLEKPGWLAHVTRPPVLTVVARPFRPARDGIRAASP